MGAHVTAHLADCQTCALLLGEAWQQLPKAEGDAAPSTLETREGDRRGPHVATFDVEPGTLVGRFVILGLIGKGGMGEVYRAHDPQLDRPVAIKLLRAGLGDPDQPGTAPLRLVQEARAMARVSHPNVIVAHEVGLHQDRVYLVMELVEGDTLEAWLGARPRSRREILDVFLQAGAGLAAAHEAGVLHRDFKPHNVMVTRKDEARITDFGLARAVQEKEWAATSAPRPEQDLKLTAAGALLGTPAYMAPEQLARRPVDARADQFSFCAALWEALSGERPYAGRTLDELSRAFERPGADRLRRSAGRVPASLRRILTRGLAPDRERRWPNMDALLAELRRTEQRWRRLPLAAAVAVALAGAVALIAARSPRDANVRCAAAAEQLDEVWSAEGGPAHRARRSLAQALLTAVPERGLALAEGVFKVLDDYSRRWQTVYQKACVAQMASPTSPSAQRAATSVMACLDEKREQLRSFVRVASAPDEIIAGNALLGASALVSPQDCEAPITEHAKTFPVADTPADEARSQAELFRAKSLLELGKVDEAVAIARELRRQADARHDPALAADAILVEVHTDDGLGACRRLEPHYWSVFRLGLRATRPDLVAEVASMLADCAALEGRWETSDDWRLLAEEQAAKLGPGRALVEAHLLTDRAIGLAYAGRHDEALELHRKALSIKRRLLPATSRDVVLSLTNVSIELLRLGRTDQAEEAFNEARPALALFAPTIPAVLNARLIEADLSLARGDAARALAVYGGVAVAEIAGRDTEGIRADAHRGMAEAALALGRLDEAFAAAEKVRQLLVVGVDPTLLCVASLVQAEVLRRRDSLGAARALVKEAIAALGRRLPEDVERLEAWLAAHPPGDARRTRTAVAN